MGIHRNGGFFLFRAKKLSQSAAKHTADTFCIGFIDFILKDKSLLEYTNLFSPDKYKKNDKIIKCFQ